MAEHMWYERAQELEAENARLRAELAAERDYVALLKRDGATLYSELEKARAELAAERERHNEAIRKLTATVATLNADLASEWERVKVVEAGLDAAVRDTLKYRGQVAKLREALAIFLGHDDRFQVAVAGNDIAVDRMLNAARAVLEETKGDRNE